MGLRSVWAAGAVVALVPLAACQKSEPSQRALEVAESRSGLDPCDPVEINRSLVVHDQATITAADFTFTRTIEAIRTTSGGAATTNAALAQTLTSGLLNTVFPQPESGLPIPVNQRSAEASLTGAGLLTQMRPIALFNRFDLAPADGAHCGEYRIVYGRYPNSTLNRFLLIFEAVLPNPNPGMGLEGCRPVAEFWHGLSDPALGPAQRAAALANFYFVGLPGFSAVVTHANYGVPLGQVRSNMFMQQPWQLREWRTSFNVSGQPVFTPDTDKDNPLAQLYNEGSFNPNPGLFASEQLAFRNDFLAVRFENLTLAEREAFEAGTPNPTGCNLVNSIGAEFLNRFNEFQSDSQGLQDDPTNLASNGFRNAITAAIGAEPALGGLTQAHILNRAGAVTCGGCHEFSRNRAIAPGTVWPGPVPSGFVHVDETGGSSNTNVPPAVVPLSPALNNCFLPARRAILETFVCQQPQPDAGVPDTGSEPDAGQDAGVQPDAGPQQCDAYTPCGPYEVCDFDLYNVCGASGPGVCLPRPDECKTGYGMEVCGCDGQTYLTECHAHMAGVAVASQGPCGGGSCPIRPPAGCCFEDSQCSRGGLCVGEDCRSGQAGVCVDGNLARGECWEDAQCGRGEVCDGAQICPCGFACLVPDSPGRCRSAGPIIGPAQLTAASADPVQDAKASFLAAPEQRTLEELEQAVEAERARERARPGAFVRLRRTH